MTMMFSAKSGDCPSRCLLLEYREHIITFQESFCIFNPTTFKHLLSVPYSSRTRSVRDEDEE
eukprot:2105161-Prorocentrum_lima.AAC.1